MRISDWSSDVCSSDLLVEKLVHAQRSVPFVQGNLIATAGDDPALVAHWRGVLNKAGVWTNDPVPLYPYPSSPDRSEEHTSELQSLMRISYAVFCLTKQNS